jgi:xanthine dehydrogenase accessory factor
VIASHGNYDEDMLVAALKSQAPYVALIASKKRAGAILEYLNEANLTKEQIARLKYPAGLDFGAVTPEEIALSILAEIIQRRRRSPTLDSSRSLPIGAISDHLVSAFELPKAPSPAIEAIDPVCGMTVEIATAHFTSEYQGKTYYFCAAGCKRSFDKEPGKYVQTEYS